MFINWLERHSILITGVVLLALVLGVNLAIVHLGESRCEGEAVWVKALGRPSFGSFYCVQPDGTLLPPEER